MSYVVKYYRLSSIPGNEDNKKASLISVTLTRNHFQEYIKIINREFVTSFHYTALVSEVGVLWDRLLNFVQIKTTLQQEHVSTSPARRSKSKPPMGRARTL